MEPPPRLDLFRETDNARRQRVPSRLSSVPPTLPTSRVSTHSSSTRIGFGGVGESANRAALPDSSEAVPSRIFRATGQPSVRMFRDPATGYTIIEARRNTQFMEQITNDDLAQLEAWGNMMLQRYRALSEGPYSLAMLRKMEHPYATAPAADGSKRKVPRRSGPRRFGGVSIGHAPGIRGSVPTMNVVNRQGRGENALADKWRMEVLHDARGVAVRIINETPQAWFVLAGTRKMVAHGPRVEEMAQRTASLNSTWTSVSKRLAGKYHQAQAQRAVESSIESAMEKL